MLTFRPIGLMTFKTEPGTDCDVGGHLWVLFNVASLLAWVLKQGSYKFYFHVCTSIDILLYLSLLVLSVILTDLQLSKGAF